MQRQLDIILKNRTEMKKIGIFKKKLRRKLCLICLIRKKKGDAG